MESKDKSISKVYKTKDYHKFNFVEGNRNIDKNHLKKLTQSIRQKNMLEQNPIVVDELYNILDGQHRFTICEELGLDVFYVVGEPFSVEDIHLLNTNSKNWTLLDYAQSYAKIGKKDYQIVLDFAEHYGFNLTNVIAIMKSDDSQVRINFRQGKFEIDDLENAHKIADNILRFKEYYADGYKRRSFIMAIKSIMDVEGFDIELLFQKLEFQSTKLVHCVNRVEYVKLLEEIYNYRNQKRIRFW